ncbi:Multiple stress resistance protein BhsA precursor [Yersinia massiliensis]|uniref:multiple stress resistance protein BhsA n=1 Tax=Yersinia massiliensis TaxID=419257 RepID=UPI0005E54A70|nr:YdgH/BhsA/McbA-like domain containing protein [Yersinia massiliensis]CNH84804.1 Multiple stress resistance protein BhsA precursor [Yersinia massiliensis]
MKSIKNFVAVIALFTLSFGSFAAEYVSSQDAAKLEQAGVITVSGATDLSSLKAKLAEKADAAGAKSFTITSVTGNNLMHGSAVIYN